MLNCEKRLLRYIDRNPTTRFDSFDRDDRSVCLEMFRKHWIRQEWDGGFLRLTDAGRVQLLSSEEDSQSQYHQRSVDRERERRNKSADIVSLEYQRSHQNRHDYAVALFGALSAFFLDLLCTGDGLVHDFIDWVLSFFVQW